MIGKILQVFQTLVLLAAIVGFGFVTYQGYKLYRNVADRMDQIGQWIDRFANQEKRWMKSEERIDALQKMLERLKPGEARTIQDVIEEADPTPIPIDETYVQEPVKPFVVLYSIEGCGPCEQWWRDQAPQWIKAGWIVKRETSTSNRPTPYWYVWDGEKAFWIDGKLDMDSYKRAGGR